MGKNEMFPGLSRLGLLFRLGFQKAWLYQVFMTNLINNVSSGLIHNIHILRYVKEESLIRCSLMKSLESHSACREPARVSKH